MKPGEKITTEQLRKRRAELYETRTQHWYTSDCSGNEQPGTYTSADGEHHFYQREDCTYYDTLTGHIEELDYWLYEQ